MNVVDISKPENMTIIHHFTLDNVELADVETCGRHVFVGCQDIPKTGSGSVLVYEKYNATDKTMDLVHNVTGVFVFVRLWICVG